MYKHLPSFNYCSKELRKLENDYPSTASANISKSIKTNLDLNFDKKNIIMKWDAGNNRTPK